MEGVRRAGIAESRGRIRDAHVLLRLEHAVAAQATLHTRVVGRTLLVAISVISSGRETVLSSTDLGNGLDVETEFRQLPITSTTIDGIQRCVLTLCGQDSVSVVWNRVVGSVRECLAETSEHLSLLVVDEGPGIAIIGTLNSPARRMTLVAVVAVGDGVLVDRNALVVVVGPLIDGTDTTRTGKRLGGNVVIKQLLIALIVGLFNIRGRNTTDNHVLVVADEGGNQVEAIDLWNSSQLVKLNSDDVVGNKRMLIEQDHCRHVAVSRELGSGQCGGGDGASREVVASDLNAIEVDHHTGIGLGTDIHTNEVAGSELEGDSVVLSGGGGSGESRSRTGAPGSVGEGRHVPVCRRSRTVQEILDGTARVHDSANSKVNGLWRLASSNSTSSDHSSILEGDGEGTATPTVVSSITEKKGVDTHGLAEGEDLGGIRDGCDSGIDRQTRRVLKCPGSLNSTTVEGEGETEQVVRSLALDDTNVDSCRHGLTLKADGVDLIRSRWL